MEVNRQQVVIWLKRIETALDVIVFMLKQTYHKRSVPEEILKEKLTNFLRVDTAILGSIFASKEIYRKKTRSILDWIANPSNLEKGCQNHRIIQEVLTRFLEN